MSNLSSRGFTFIEIIVVLAIVSIISLMGSSFYSRFLTQNSVTNTTDHLISQLRKSQGFSIMGKQTGGVWGAKYTTSPIKQITLYLQGNPAFDEDYPVNENITISPEFDVLFEHLSGVPTGATFPLTITITGNNSSESLTINSQGVVSKN